MEINYYILLVPIMLFSLTVHEYSHAVMAHLLGDDTAKSQGRLSFNPLKHLDPIGTVFFLMAGVGWARPVPVDPRNLKDRHRDMLFIAAAGPASNLTLGLLMGLGLYLMSPWPNEAQMTSNQILAFSFMWLALFTNIGLVMLNMLPVFPLDGSSVLKGLVPRRLAFKLDDMDKYFGLGLLAVVLVDQFTNAHILHTILRLPIEFVVKFITQDIFPVTFHQASL